MAVSTEPRYKWMGCLGSGCNLNFLSARSGQRRQAVPCYPEDGLSTGESGSYTSGKQRLRKDDDKPAAHATRGWAAMAQKTISTTRRGDPAWSDSDWPRTATSCRRPMLQEGGPSVKTYVFLSSPCPSSSLAIFYKSVNVKLH